MSQLRLKKYAHSELHERHTEERSYNVYMPAFLLWPIYMYHVVCTRQYIIAVTGMCAHVYNSKGVTCV